MAAVRRPFKILALLGLLLYVGNAVQAWVWVHHLPVLNSAKEAGPASLKRTAILVAGQGNDEVEDATCRRDLAYAANVIIAESAGRAEVKTLVPGQPDYSAASLLESIKGKLTDDLIIYLTGHGGGTNFGAAGGLNLRRDQLAEALAKGRFQRAVVVVDCCWSGEFARSFEQQTFPGPVTLITSTDADHMTPFPTSFLSPSSFGRTLFSRWSDGPQAALAAANESRRKWKALYGENVGVEGEIWEYGGKPTAR